MKLTTAVLLGLVQGVTEFLPISSSGHLAIFGRNVEDFGLYAIVMFHAGTLLSILAYYHRDVASLSAAGVRFVAAAGRAALGRENLRQYLMTDAGARVALLVIVGCVPTAVIGLCLRGFSSLAVSPGHLKVVGGLFIITGALVYQCDRFAVGSKGIGGAGVLDALTVGVFQGLAVMPGLSRSGLTIFAGVMRGIERRDAARFSFLLAVPAIIGAMILEVPKGAHRGDLAPAVIGAAVACVSGYASICLLVRILTSRRLRYFAVYLLTLGLLVLVWMK